MGFLGVSKGLGCMLQRLPGKLVTCLMIAFAMVRGCRLMSVRGHFVKFGGSLV
jgi:hypothetical protein